MKAYLITETEAGAATKVIAEIEKLSMPNVKATTVTGPYDIIAEIESYDLTKINEVISQIDKISWITSLSISKALDSSSKENTGA